MWSWVTFRVTVTDKKGIVHVNYKYELMKDEVHINKFMNDLGTKLTSNYTNIEITYTPATIN